MKMRTVEFTVGAFMVAGILSLLLLALQVSGLSSVLKEARGYQVKAEFSNIGSLKVKAKVTLAGVVIGRVTKIELEPETFNATVSLTIDPERIEKLPSDSRASILTAGLLGDNYISITPGFDDQTFLHEGSVIAEGNTDSAVIFEQMLSRFLAGQASKAGKEEDSAPAAKPNAAESNAVEHNPVESKQPVPAH